ncbi:hypothetical protein PIB30_085246 [Stylosanthes scabra]|uniref:Uncharacterized protein n=1 Tax=Stylosanthes scabra TaxID=79078 RepID=A0ABU6QSC3_9FABA|nr:hypothetical protein [Stylosanthes scabra]
MLPGCLARTLKFQVTFYKHICTLSVDLGFIILEKPQVEPLPLLHYNNLCSTTTTSVSAPSQQPTSSAPPHSIPIHLLHASSQRSSNKNVSCNSLLVHTTPKTDANSSMARIEAPLPAAHAAATSLASAPSVDGTDSLPDTDASLTVAGSLRKPPPPPKTLLLCVP